MDEQKKIIKAAVKKLDELGYSKSEIARLTDNRSITDCRRIVEMTPEKIEHLMNQLVAL